MASNEGKVIVNGETWLTTNAIMKMFGFRSPSTVGSLYRKGLKATKIGRSYAVREKDLSDFMIKRQKHITANLNPA